MLKNSFKINHYFGEYMSNFNLDNYLNNFSYMPEFLRNEEQLSNFVKFLRYYYSEDSSEHNLFNSLTDEEIYNYLFNTFFREIASYGFSLKKIISKHIKFYNLEDVLDYFRNKTTNHLTENEISAMNIRFEEAKKYDYQIEYYKKELKYLPDYLRDFHNQKDLFKMIHGWYNQNYKETELLKKISFREGQIFIIDFVLWCLVRYGYKIQYNNMDKSKFNNYSEQLNNWQKVKNETEISALTNFLKKT